jgi:hypothetical protein
MKAAYFRRCQVETPPDVVDVLWNLASQFRGGESFGNVLDLGAGDGRFGRQPQRYRSYTGVEKDAAKVADARLPRGSRLVVGDALAWPGSGYGLAIGNPPYIRHHGLEPHWRDAALARIARAGGPTLKKTANAFVIFLTQALLKTDNAGLVVQLVPYEWVTRPSALELREYIQAQGWNVYVYRFDANIFPTVLTTASVTVIDKAGREGLWQFGQIGRAGEVRAVPQATGSRSKAIAYSAGTETLHAIRGLSPGGQDLFVLTEEERLFFGLRRRTDVVPAVTSLRHLDESTGRLTTQAFEQHYVAQGRRCWLIRSDREKLSPALTDYLRHVGPRWKQYSTCTTRSPWWRYKPHPVPAVLVASGFIGKAPKVVVNEAKAIAVGSVYGIVTDAGAPSARTIAQGVGGFDFGRRIVHHSNNLKKLEVRQLNTILNQLFG